MSDLLSVHEFRYCETMPSHRCRNDDCLRADFCRQVRDPMAPYDGLLPSISSIRVVEYANAMNVALRAARAKDPGSEFRKIIEKGGK